VSITVTPEQMARIDRERRTLKKMLDQAVSDMEKAERSGEFNDDLVAAMILGLACNPSGYLHAVKDAAESGKER
jgi:hypothetical protein